MFKCSVTLNQWDLIVILHKYKTAQFCCITSDCWNQLFLKTEDFWFLSHYKCLWVWTGFWKAWWNQFCESPPPLDTQSSLCGRQQLAASATHKDYCQRATTETRTKPEPRTTADPHGHNIQNTLSGPIRLHSTRSISLADHGTGTEER